MKTRESRPYQSRIVSQVIKCWMEQGLNNVLVESPTGSGKTFIGISILEELEAIHGKDNICFVWVAMRRFLLGQIKKELVEFDSSIELHPLSMFDADGAKELKKQHNGKTFVIVLDEAQHDAASSMTDIYATIEPQYVLGLSATPYRADKARIGFEKQIRDAGINRLMQDGYLSKYDLNVIEDWKPTTVARHYLSDIPRWGKSVFYFLTLEDCREYSHILKTAGITHHLVTGDDNEKTRERQLEDFKTGVVECLVNCMVLTEGFDCPELQSSWVRPSSRGPTMQMAGRAFRKYKGITKNIIQSRDTKYPMNRCAIPVQQRVFMDGRWADAKPNEKLNEISISMVQRVLKNHQPLPEYILGRQKKAKQAPWMM